MFARKKSHFIFFKYMFVAILVLQLTLFVYKSSKTSSLSQTRHAINVANDHAEDTFRAKIMRPKYDVNCRRILESDQVNKWLIDVLFCRENEKLTHEYFT